jgi:hypothetical protein
MHPNALASGYSERLAAAFGLPFLGNTLGMAIQAFNGVHVMAALRILKSGIHLFHVNAAVG